MPGLFQKRKLLIFSLFFIVALFFHLYRLGDIPFGLNNDAAWEGSAAIDMLRGNWKNYVPYAAEGWRGEPIIRLTVLPFMLFLGTDPITIRFASTAWGLALFFPLYLLIKELFDPKRALITTFFAAISGWHIIMSRSGWRAITVPTLITVTLLFLIKAFGTKKLLWSLAAGISMGLTLYTYDAARVVPFLVVCLIIAGAIQMKHFWKTHGRAVAVLFLFFELTIAPLAIYAVGQWHNLINRGDFLFVGRRIMSQQSLSPLIQNIRATTFLFTHRGNGNDFFVNDPLLDPPMNWLFPIGLVATVIYAFRKKQKNYQFMLVWFAAGLVPGVLSAPNGNRAIVSLVPAIFFVSEGTLWILALIQRRFSIYQRPVAGALFLFVCSFAAMATYLTYFGPYRREISGFYPETFVAAGYAKNLSNEYRLYFMNNFPRETLTYLLYDSGNPFARTYTWIVNPADILSVTPSYDKGAALFFPARQESRDIIKQILTRYPQAKRHTLTYETESILRDAALVVVIPTQNQTRIGAK